MNKRPRLSTPVIISLCLIAAVVVFGTITAFMQNPRPAPLKPGERWTLHDQKKVAKEHPNKGDEQAPSDPSPLAPTASGNYTFATATNASFTDMSSGTSPLMAGLQDDTPSSVTNIGFDFYFLGTRYTQFSASSNGYVQLGGTPITGPQYVLGVPGSTLIAALGSDEMTSGTGKVHYKITGAAPNRVLTIEFVNMTIIYDNGAGATADGTCQVRLNETTGVVELVYGSMNRNTSQGFNNGLDPQFIGFATNTTDGTFATVNGATNAVNTTGGLVSNQFTQGSPMVNLNTPVDGSRRIYSFTPATPTAPTNLTFTGVTSSAMTLNWTDSPDESLYAIYRSIDGTNYSFVNTAAQNAVSFNATGLNPGTTYFWRVFAVSDGALSSALSGSQSTVAAPTITSTGSGNWTSTTPNAPWPSGVVPTATDNVVIANGSTVTINTTAPTCLNLTVGQGTSGTLQYITTPLATLTVNGDVTVAAGGIFTAGTGTLTTHVLNIGGSSGASTAFGNLTVNGTFDMNTTAGVTTNFRGSSDGTISGTGATCDFFAIVMNKGASITPVLDVTRVITQRAAVTATPVLLTMTNGTFKLSSASTLTPYFNSQTISAATGRLWLNNAAASIACVGTGTNTGAGAPTISGTLQVDHGTFGYGSGNNTMTVSGGGTLMIGGADATVNQFGAVVFSNNSTFNMTAGNFNVDPQAANALGATVNIVKFGTTNTGTVNVAFTGGTLTIVDPHAATGNGRALSIQSGNAAAINLVGSTIRFGNGVSTTAGSADGFDMDPFVGNQEPNLGNIIIDNTAANAATRFVRAQVALTPFQIPIIGDVTLTNAGGSRLNLNGHLVGFGKDLINNGIIDGTAANSALYWIGNGVASNYSGTGTVTAPLVEMDIDNSLGVTISAASSPIVVGSRMNIFRGTFINSNKITIGNAGANSKTVTFGAATFPFQSGGFDQAPTFNLGTGSYIVSYQEESGAKTTGFEIPSPSNAVTNMTVGNPNGVVLGGNINVSGTLALGGNKVTTNANTLAIGSAGTVTRTSGYVIGNLKKTYAAAGSKTFEVGTGNGYSPVAANATAGTFPADFTAKAVQGVQPNVPGTNKLARYWSLTATGITADLTFNYLAGDVTGTESNYKIFKYDGSLTSFSPTTLDTTNHIATLNGVSSFSDWTLGEEFIVAPGTIQFSAVTYSSDEGTIATITAARTAGTLGAVSVDYATSSGGGNPATPGAACGGSVDYVSTAGTLSWADGDSTTKSFNITICGDSPTEATETAILTLSNPTGGATIGANNPATLSILDVPLIFCNNTPIVIPDSGVATPYPSTITVSGLSGVVSSVKVSLKNMTHTFPDDIDVLLVGPGGQKFVLMSDVGGGNGLTGQTFDIYDAAPALFSDSGPLPSGSYKPTNVEDFDLFDSPAPGGPYSSPASVGTDTLNSVFGGTNPNGTWSLYVIDDAGGDQGSIANGWCLDIATGDQVQFSSPTYSAVEGNLATITVNRGTSSGAVSVNYATSAGTATPGTCGSADYVETSGTLSWADGDGTPKQFTVQLCTDAVDPEADETVNLTLSGAVGAAISGTNPAILTISNNSPGVIQFSTPVFNADEGTSATITATRTGGGVGPVSIDYATSSGGGNPATPGAACGGSVDYVATNGTLSWPDGDTTTKSFTVTLCSDAVPEATETAILTLSNPTGGATTGLNNPATLNILDVGQQFCNTTPILIPSQGTATPYPSNVNVAGMPGVVTNVRVVLKNISHTFQSDVDILLVGPGGQKFILVSDVGGSTPVSGQTWTIHDAAPGLLSGGANPTGSYQPTNYGGGDVFPGPAPTGPYTSPAPAGAATLNGTFGGTNPNGTWSLYVYDAFAPDGGSIADGWCLEIASAETVQFSAATYNAAENSGLATITVNRSGTTGPLSVNYATTPGNATAGGACGAGTDYVTTSGTLNYLGGEASKSFDVPICDDAVFDGLKTVNLTLSGVVGGAVIGTPGTAVLSINDNEPAPTISISGVTVNEGAGSATFVVTQSFSTSADTTFQYSTGNVTAVAGADYTAATNAPASILAGSTMTNVVVPILQDTGFESSETFTVSIGNAMNATVAVPTATGTITDDDVPVLYTVNSNNNVSDGVCNGTHCSLREAITAANAAPGIISFAPSVTGTILITGAAGALPDITNSMNIVGPGATTLTVSGNNIASRTVFNIPIGSPSVQISGLTITGGNNVPFGNAGAITNGATLAVSDCVITGNAGAEAGGILDFGNLDIRNTTMSNNTGGRVSPPDGCSTTGGAISVSSGAAVVTVSNSTISGNTATGCSFNNGGIMVFDGHLTVTNSTITNNTSNGGGAALANNSVTFPIVVRNSIVAANAGNLDVLGVFSSSGFNLIGNADGVFDFAQPTDQTGTLASPLNPMLGALANNGGTTTTRALLAGSPAIDKGFSFGSTTDQRSAVRPSDDLTIANAVGGDGSDIGAYELTVITDTDVSMVGGNLVITDTNGGNTDDTLTISLNGANVRINDPNHTLTGGAGAVQIDANTVEVPLASISGNIQFNTLGGNDLVTLNFSGGNMLPAGGLSYAGGTQTAVPGDRLAIVGGSQGTVTYNYTNANDGSINMSSYGTVSYTGLEPISNSGNATDVVFNLPAGPNAATLADDGSGGNSLSRLSGATFETTDFSNPTGSLTINRGNVADTLAVNALPDFTATLALGTSANPFSTLTFNGAVTLAANKNLSGEASGTISLAAAASDLLTSGTGTISLKTARNVTLIAGSSLETVNGGITVEANQQVGPTAGNFTGLDIATGALVRTTGSGNLSLLGKGGADGATAGHRGIRSVGTITSTSGAGGAGSITLNGVGGAGVSGNNGVEIVGGANVSSVNGNVSITGQGAAATGSTNFGVTVAGTSTVIQSTGTATVTLMGTGGAGTLGNSGVNVDLNAVVTSAIGDIQITGQGTGTTASNLGVIVSNGAAVSSTGAAKVTISGTGGSGGTTALGGVNIQGVSGANHARVTSAGGDLSITGVAGSGSSSANIGVFINSGGAVTATGSAKITIAGTGSSGTLVNPGIYVDSFGVAGTTISAVNGDITITGVATDTTGTNQDGVVFQDSSAAVAVAVTTTGTGAITINGTAGNNDPTSAGIHLVDDTTITATGASNSFVADTMSIGASAVSINAGANTITLRQKTNGIAIDLGGADSATQLGLTDAELDRFTAGTLNLGNGASGAITVSAAITRAAATVLSLVAGANIDIAAGSLNSNGGNVALNPGTNVFPSHTGVDVTTGAAATLALTSGKDLKIDIDGTTVDSGYTQLSVAGLVNLNSANLSFAGSSYTPVGGESFVIVNNDGADAITGTFANGPTFTNFLGSGLTANLSYTGGDGNDAVLTVNAACTPPSIVYVDDSWVGTPIGTDPDGGGPATNFGCDSFATIQGGVDGVAASGTVNVAAGTYTENVTITKALTLTGASAASVFVRPATSNPNCGGAGGGSLCAGGSNIILVQANNVTISGLTLDGDNPALTSGEVFGGADLDARNGIITNHLLGTFNNLQVHHTTIRNIWLRGVYASSGGTFNFHDNTVQNVQANFASIGMFNFGGAGAYTNNNVSLCNDAISSNHSRGTTYTGNTVTTSASGIHSDNAGDGGGTPDTISGNTVTNSQPFGYGIWVFVPYKTVTVQNNTVNNVDVGLAVFGDSGVTTTTKPNQSVNAQGAAAERMPSAIKAPGSINVEEPFAASHILSDLTISGHPHAPPVAPFSASFTGNTVNGQNKAGSTGVYFTTSQISFGSANPKVAFTSNTVVNNVDGFYLEAETGFTLETASSFNRIVNNTNSQVTQASGAGFTGTLNGSMENNWWGCNAGPNTAGCGAVVGSGVDFDPWIVLSGSAVPNTINPGGSSTVTADMTHNSAAAVPSGTLPDMAVSYSATNGTMNPTSGTVLGGTDSSVFTSSNNMSAVATITVDNQPVNVPITISATPSYTWVGTVNSDWQIPLNWSPARLLPGTSDILFFNGSMTPAPIVTNIPTQTIGALHVINGAFVTLQASAPHTLTISGGTGTDLTVNQNSVLTLDNSNSITIMLSGPGTLGQISGGVVMQAGFHRLFGDANGSITFQNGATCTAGPGLTSNPFGTGGAGDGAAGSVLFANGASYFHNAGQSPFGSVGNGPVAVFQTGSTAHWLTSSGFQASGRTYANLVIGNATTATNVSDGGAGNFQFDGLTVNSTSSTNSSLTFTGSGSSTVTLRGDITSNGAGDGSTTPDITLSGGSGGVQVQVPSGTVIFSVDGSNARTIDFESDVTVASGTTLTLARKLLVGITQPSSFVLSVGGALNGSSTGYVIGNVKRSFTGAESFTYHVGTVNGYSPMDANVTAATGSLTAVAVQGSQPVLAAATSLQRYWTLTEAGTVTADLTFHYLDPTDIAGNEANYRIIKVESGNATSFPNACPVGNFCVDPSANTATAKGVSTFSDWTVAEPNAPTAVRLAGFTATRTGDEVTIQWQSGYEAHNLGYYVYREQNGKRTQITPSLVAGSALTVGTQTVMTAGRSYAWYDQGERTGRGQHPDALKNVTYWLEDVDVDGTRTLHGPIAPTFEANGKQSRPAQSEMLGEAQRKAGTTGTTFRSWAADFAEQQKELLTPPVLTGNKLPLTQAEIAASPGLKIAVTRTGWYRVTQAEMLSAGFNPKDTEPLLQLYANAVEVPIKISNNGTLSNPADYLEFYGHGLDSPTDAAQTYYLVVGQNNGKRIGLGAESHPAQPVGPVSFDFTIERKDRFIYYAALLNGDGENTFGHIVRPTAVSEALPVNHPDPAGGQARLEVSLVGVTQQAHNVTISLNGQNLGTVTFSNNEHPSQSFNVPASLLLAGDNTVQFASLGGDTDISLVDTMRLTYAHLYVADSGSLTISTNSSKTKRVLGFTSGEIRAMDITNVNGIVEVRPQVDKDDAGNYYADIQVPAANARTPHTLLVFAEQAVAHPDSIQANEPSAWRTHTVGSDYLIITTQGLKASVEPLAALRRAQGLVVDVIDVDDLYDEFSYGLHTPQAIKSLVQTANASWTRKPHYLLLAGDASYDPKNYTGQGYNDLVPTKLLDTALLETASDDWLADLNGDGVADLAVGRLPVRNAATLNVLVAKIINYENMTPDPTRAAMLVADNSFEANSNAVQLLLPSGLPVQIINRSSADDATTHTQIISSLNQGPKVANYFGHGSNGVWTSAGLLSANDAAGLTNQNRLSVFVMMTCFNGYFHDATFDSLSEALLKSPGGAVAVWASSGMTDPSSQSAVDLEVYRQLFGGANPALGDAVRAAKQTTSDADVRRTWILFGDPAMRLR